MRAGHLEILLLQLYAAAIGDCTSNQHVVADMCSWIGHVGHPNGPHVLEPENFCNSSSCPLARAGAVCYPGGQPARTPLAYSPPRPLSLHLPPPPALPSSFPYPWPPPLPPAVSAPPALQPMLTKGLLCCIHSGLKRYWWCRYVQIWCKCNHHVPSHSGLFLWRLPQGPQGWTLLGGR